jgi:hypothetical protein
MSLELKPIAMRHVYEIRDEVGYNYTVYVTKDDEFGSWSASVTISAWGVPTPEGAVEALAPALHHLLQKIVGDDPKPSSIK